MIADVCLFFFCNKSDYFHTLYIRSFVSLPSSLPDPKFVAAHLIPDNVDRDNDKVYFFFTEKAVEAGDSEGAIHTRVGRVCAVSSVSGAGESPLTRS